MACPYNKSAAPAPVAPIPMGQMMNAICVEKFGGPEVLELKKVPIPSPEADEILIKVFTIGVNPVEVYCRAGSIKSLIPTVPFVPGGDVAGVVQQVGEKVTKFRPGEQVYTFGRKLKGGYAEFAAFPEAEVFRLHENLQFSQGAAIGIPYFTAYKALFMLGNAKPGDIVLIHGASGGVGTAACQIARAHGLRVIGTAGSQQGMDMILKNGAHMAFNHREEGYISQIKESTASKGVNVILEMVAKKNLNNDIGLLAKRGCIIVAGGSEGSLEFSPTSVIFGELTIRGVQSQGSADEEMEEIGAALYSGMEQGWLRPVIGREFPLAQASEAHIHVIGQQSGSQPGSRGKVILSI